MKKGFTLVELLAVIVILGILSVLIVPKIVNTLNDSEQKTNMTSAQNLLKAAQYKVTNDDISGNLENITIDYTTGQNIDKLDFSGSKPEKGQINLRQDSQIAMAVKIGDDCYFKEFSETDIKKKPYDVETCEVPLSFAIDSWEEIKANITSNRNYYPIGSKKEVEIDLNRNGIISDSEKFLVRLVNTETPQECNASGFSKTACGVVIEFKDIIQQYTFYYGPSEGIWSSNEGGWPGTYSQSSSGIYKYINTTLYNKLPQDLKNVIINTYTVSGYGKKDTSNFTSTDKLYLLSYAEIWGSNYEYDTVKIAAEGITGNTRQLEYYKSIIENSGRIKYIKYNNGTIESKAWWLRSAYLNNSSDYICVHKTGTVCHWESDTTPGVAPAFRILD